MGGNTSKEQIKQENSRFSQPIPVKDEDYTKPLPREKLPENLQKIVDNEESLWDTLYDGGYVKETRPHYKCCALSIARNAFLLIVLAELLNPQSQTYVMLPTQHERGPSFYLPIATLPTHPTLANPSDLSLIRGS